MERPFPSYRGNEAYTFVCYAHDDASVVYPEMQWLNERGAHLWYDEGISAGKNWRAEISDSLQQAAHVLFYISKASLASDHCNRETNFALDEGIEIIPVYLEETELTPDLKIGLNRVQALHRQEDENYQRHLLHSLNQVASDLPNQVTRSGPNRVLLTGVAFALAAVLAIGLWYLIPGAVDEPLATTTTEPVMGTDSQPRIAVMPLENHSAEPDQLISVLA